VQVVQGLPTEEIAPERAAAESVHEIMFTDLPPLSKQTELHVRLRLLAERGEWHWTLKEMKATLAAGGVAAHESSNNMDELRRQVKALAAAAQARWIAEAEEEVRATVAAEAKRTAMRKFQARGRKEKPSARGDEVSDTSEDESMTLSDDEEAKTQTLSHRDRFRARGAAHQRADARRARDVQVVQVAMSQNEERAERLRSFFGADLCRGVSQCLARPALASS